MVDSREAHGADRLGAEFTDGGHFGFDFLQPWCYRLQQALAGRGGVPHQAFNSSPLIGSLRIRLPVAAAIALTTAGATGGRAGSPIPLGASVDAMR